MTNIMINTDSYKASHFMQYPPKTEKVSSYIESRGGKWDTTVFFGLQMFLQEYLSKAITQADIDEAVVFWAEHGEPFNVEGWQYILDFHNGRLPLTIQSVPEGTVIGVKNVLVQVSCTDKKCFWLPSFLETALLRAVWYPTTVATASYRAKVHIKAAIDATSDENVDEVIGFKMHDFGPRGVSSYESAGIGGAAHLVNFMGTDNTAGILWARKFYGEHMAGFSIPASEHSTMTSWGQEPGEILAMTNMIEQYDAPGAIFACVSDSYDIWKAIDQKWGGELHQKVMGLQGTLVVRPDSGNPITTPVQVIKRLMDSFGYTTNSKGYKVLPRQVRVLQGDGITEETIQQILLLMKTAKLSVDNIAFGQGGGLLQQLDRDTLQFAMKASSITVDGDTYDVFKSPMGMEMKKSKRGVLGLLRVGDAYVTVREEQLRLGQANELKTVWENGYLMITETFGTIRERANKPFAA